MTVSFRPIRRREPGRLAAEARITAVEEVPLDERHRPPSTYDLLVTSAEGFGAAPAFRILPAHGDFRTQHTTTYRKLPERIQQVANLLRSRGMRRHHAVSLLLPNVPEMC